MPVAALMARTSPRKLKPVQTGRVQRQPQRCRQCPNQPLRSQCCHTLQGRKYLEAYVCFKIYF